MSWVEIRGDGELRYAEMGEFHRVTLSSNEVLEVRATDKPLAVWVPSGYSISITHRESGVVLDLAEVVEHEDIVTLDRKIREEIRRRQRAERKERQAKRRLRGAPERPVPPNRP